MCVEEDLGLLQHPDGVLCDNSLRFPAVNYYHKELQIRRWCGLKYFFRNIKMFENYFRDVLQLLGCCISINLDSMHGKRSFLFNTFWVNVNKSTINFGFLRISVFRQQERKITIFVQWIIRNSSEISGLYTAVKMKFSSVNVTKHTVPCRFGHIYRRNS